MIDHYLPLFPARERRRGSLAGRAVAAWRSPAATSSCAGQSPVQRRRHHRRRTSAGDFALTDHNGRKRLARGFSRQGGGAVLRLYPVPGRLPDHAVGHGQGDEAAGPDAARVQVLFVTVDPKRDTPELLSLRPAVQPGFLGLYAGRGGDREGDEGLQDLRAGAAGRRRRAVHRRPLGADAVFDAKGKLRLAPRATGWSPRRSPPT